MILVVKIHNPKKYPPFAKEHGIIIDLLPCTAVVNWNGNGTVICTNIAHGDYHILPRDMYEVIHGEVYVKTRMCTYEPTGLKVY